MADWPPYAARRRPLPRGTRTPPLTQTKKDWEAIARLIPGATAKSCMFKFVSLRKFRLAQHKWQKEEERLLSSIIARIGTENWKNIAEALYE